MNLDKLFALGDLRMEATAKAPPRLARGLNALLGDISLPQSADGDA